MADDKKKEEKKEEAAAAPEAAGSSMLLIVGLVISILFGLAGFGTAGYVIMTKSSTEELATEEASADAAHGDEGEVTEVTEEDELDEGEQAIGAIYPLESFIVNLSGGRYLRAQVRLEFEEREVPKRIFTRVVPIRDLLIQIMAAKRAEDLLSSLGKENLKKEIKDKINELLRREDVRNVYFAQFVVQ